MKLAIVVLVALLGGVAHAQPRPAPHKAQLRQLLLHHFDRNHDGKLGPRERKRAAKALRRLAHKLDKVERVQHRRQHRRFIRRFDHDRDGRVGPGELPPALADELRPLDRDGDGWLRGDELP